jgi:hypothetical protein
VKAITLALILSGVANYVGVSGVPGTDGIYACAYEQPSPPPEPDNEEDEHRVRPRGKRKPPRSGG